MLPAGCVPHQSSSFCSPLTPAPAQACKLAGLAVGALSHQCTAALWLLLHSKSSCPSSSLLLAPAQAGNLAGFQWEAVDENAACGLCYTSGTTGPPKVSTGLSRMKAAAFPVAMHGFHHAIWLLPMVVIAIR